MSYNVTLVSQDFSAVSQKLVLVSTEYYVAWSKTTNSVPW